MATSKVKKVAMKPRTSAIDTRPAAKAAKVTMNPKPKQKPKPKATTKAPNPYMSSIDAWQKMQNDALTRMWNNDKKKKTAPIRTK